MVGSAKDIADQLEQRFVERACDGFVVAATHIPGAFKDFVRLVISELRRRGLHHREYEGLTLRENLGLGLRSRGYWNSWGGGCRQPACFCKREATDRASAGSTLAGRGKPNRSRRVFVS